MTPAARMLGLDGGTLVLAAGGGERAERLRAAGAEVEVVPGDAERLDLGAVLARLAAREVNEVLVEAGPTLAGAFVAGGWADELIVYLAPHLMGDAALGGFHLPGLGRMADRVPLEITDVRAVGPDWRIIAKVRETGWDMHG